MKVENKTDRQNHPEECDCCGSKVKLTRYYTYGPGHNVDWLCEYCSQIFSYESRSQLERTMAAMFNVLQKNLIAEIKKQSSKA